MWLRNGAIWKSGLGGFGWLFPLIDQILILPAAIQLSKIDLEVYDYQQAQKTVIIDLEINWRIITQEIFYRKFFSITGNNIKNDELEQLYKSYLRDSLANKTIDEMFRKSRSMMNEPPLRAQRGQIPMCG